MLAERVWATYAALVDWVSVRVGGQLETAFSELNSGVNDVSWGTAVGLLGFFVAARLLLLASGPRAAT